MPALEFVLGNVTAPGATTPAALTAAAGQSFTIRSYDQGKAHLVDLIGFAQSVGLLRVRSPRMHDLQQGIRLRFPANTPAGLLPCGLGADQPLESQDNLIVEMLGGGAGKIEEGILGIYYETLPGIQARFIDPQGLHLLAGQQMGNECAVVTGATGGWSGTTALNATFDTLQAGVDYAVLGATMDVVCAAACLYGAETGNLRVAVPGHAINAEFTRDYFVRLSNQYGVPMIPVINGSNKAAVFCEVAQNDAGADVNVTWILQQLNGSGPGAK